MRRGLLSAFAIFARAVGLSACVVSIAGCGSDTVHATAAVPWKHVAVGDVGGYDYPLLTLWNGTGWDPRGVVPDPRSEDPSNGIAVSYNCYAWEITMPGRRMYPGGSTDQAFVREDLDSFVTWWSGQAGSPVQMFNQWQSVVADGTSSAVQLVPAVPMGTPTAGSPNPACDGPNHDQGQGLFAIAVPPFFDAHRARRYPVVFVNPGTTTALLELFLMPEAWRTVEGAEYWPRLLGESVRNGGNGVIVLFGSAGGQGSQGMNDEYASAVNEAMQFLADHANADISQVVTTGISRGASNALAHASRSGRNYTVVGAFADVPATRYRMLANLPLPLIHDHGFFVTSTCGSDPDCAHAWLWDHTPAPGAAPYNALLPLFDTADLDEVDNLSPWGQRDGFDTGAWVELCSGDRDHAAGAGLAFEYMGSLPNQVHARLNYVFGSAHGGSFYYCDEHMRELVLDRLAGNGAYAGRFAAVSEGTFYYRVPLDNQSTSWGTAAADYSPMTVAGCGSPPPVLVVPYWQEYREAARTAEPGGFLLSGDLSRRWRVDLTLGVSSATPVLSWQGGGGAVLPQGCEPFPVSSSITAILCRYSAGIENCTGGASIGCGAASPTCRALCGWRLAFDCNDDGVAEDLNPQFTPFLNWSLVGTQAQAGAQSFAYLVVAKQQCYGAAGSQALGLPPCIPTTSFSPYVGYPETLSPCLNLATADCTP